MPTEHLYGFHRNDNYEYKSEVIREAAGSTKIYHFHRRIRDRTIENPPKCPRVPRGPRGPKEVLGAGDKRSFNESWDSAFAELDTLREADLATLAGLETSDVPDSLF